MTITVEEWAAKRAVVVRREQERTRTRKWAAPSAASVERRRARYYKQPVKVYRLVFPDGMTYVSTTVQTINSRLSGHRNKCSAVGRRLDLGERPDIRVLAEYQRANRDLAENDVKNILSRVPVLKRLDFRTVEEDAAIQAGMLDPEDIAKFRRDPDLLRCSVPNKTDTEVDL